MATAPPLPSRSRSPPGSMNPCPRMSMRDHFKLPLVAVQERGTRVPFPRSTDATAALMGALMPEPPGRMRRDRIEAVGKAENRSGSRSENERGKGSRDSPIAVDVDVAVRGRVNGERDGEKIVGSDGKNEDEDGRSRQKAVLSKQVLQDLLLQTSIKDKIPEMDEGSSIEKPVVIDEGYGSFSFEADTRTKLEQPTRDGVKNHGRYHPLDELFEDDVEAGKSAVLRAQGERDRKGVVEKAEEEAVIGKVNSLLRSRRFRTMDWRAEVETSQGSNHDGHRPKGPDTMDNSTRGLLDVVRKEAQRSMQSTSAAREERSGKSTPALPQWLVEVPARKRDAIERSRSARASDGNDNTRRAVSNKDVHPILLDPEDDAEQLRLAQGRLIADLASKSQAKRKREEERLRKEKEANEPTILVRGPSNAQKAMTSNQERTRKRARPTRNDEELMVAEAKMIAERQEEERQEEERRRQTNVDEEERIKKIVAKLEILKKKSGDEIRRRIERNRIDEGRRAKAAEKAGRSSVRIKVEDSGSDDAIRSSLARDCAGRQAAAERSRSLQVQSHAEEKPKLVEARSTRKFESGQTSVALRLSASGDEALVGNRISAADSSALESQLYQVNGILQAAQAQKRILEVEAEAEARRVQAECTALKRRAEEPDMEDVIEESIHKKARSAENSVHITQSIVSSRNPSSHEDITSPYDTEMRPQGRPPTRTLEERMNRKKEMDKRWRLKKQLEEKLWQAQSQQEGIKGSIGNHQSKRSSIETQDDDGTDSRQTQPMGFRALCTSDLISQAQGLREVRNGAGSGEQPKMLQKQAQNGRRTSNADMRSVDPRRDDKAKTNMIRDRAAKDDEINKLRAQLARFQQPLADQDGGPGQTGTTEPYTAENPIQQERQETVSSDEDEDETQEARTSQPFRLSGPHQPLDMPGEAQPPQPRPTFARKTLPAQTHELISEEDDSDKGVSSDQESKPNEMVWGYQVIRKEWLNDEDPNDVGQTTDGPYWSKDQANSIAATEVHQERGNVTILAPMEFNMTIDALGMRTHSICSMGGNIATTVDRVLIPPSRANGPMADKAWLPHKLFVALEKVSVGLNAADSSQSSSGERVPRTSSVRVLGIFTVLDLANREASRCALDHQTSRLGESELDQIVKAEKEMKAREHLQVLDRDFKTFENSCAVSDGSGVVEIWVEEHPVLGPRN